MIDRPSREEIQKMSNEEMVSYLTVRMEKIISQAPPEKQLQYRALQAKCNGIHLKKHWTPLQKADKLFQMMMEEFSKLNDSLAEFRSE